MPDVKRWVTSSTAIQMDHNGLGQRSPWSRSVTSGHIVIGANNYSLPILCVSLRSLVSIESKHRSANSGRADLRRAPAIRPSVACASSLRTVRSPSAAAVLLAGAAGCIAQI
jgi:hypothetical protein